METLKKGDTLHVKASDPAFSADIESWAKSTGNILLESGRRDGAFYALIRKGGGSSSSALTANKSYNDKAMIVFSDDLDKAIAAFIIANGAAAMGRKVTLFFTFWGINIVRKHQAVDVEKDMMSNMFGKMMPRGSKNLALSKMNMAGMGPKMIRDIMKKHGVDSLEVLIKKAQDNGVRFVVCTMSMELLGIQKEELLDGVDFGGVASYLSAAEQSDMSLFI